MPALRGGREKTSCNTCLVQSTGQRFRRDNKHFKSNIFMKRTSFLMLMLAFVLAASAQTEFTRGIGKYPGRPSENFAPNLVPDNSYRNLALNRAATASSSVDYNLTAQLATDGIVSTTTPVTLEVRTPEGKLSLRDKEKNVRRQYSLGEHPARWKNVHILQLDGQGRLS